MDRNLWILPYLPHSFSVILFLIIAVKCPLTHQFLSIEILQGNRNLLKKSYMILLNLLDSQVETSRLKISTIRIAVKEK